MLYYYKFYYFYVSWVILRIWSTWTETRLSGSREVFDLQGYWLELRNKNERVKLLEDREKEMDNIQDVLDSADSYNHSWTFYIHNWKYYNENPLRVNPENPSDIIYLRTTSKSELQDRLSDLQDSLAENNIIEELRHFDKLISESEDNPNLRAMLIETRIALTWIDETSYLAKSDSLNSFLHLVEKSETTILSVSENFALIWHGLNIARYYVPDKTSEYLSWFKDVTSSKLFKYWEENAPWEQYIQNLVMKYSLADSTDDTIVEISKIPPAVLAGGLDGALDYIQSNIDIMIVPDKVLWWLVDLLPIIADNIGTLWNELVEWIENESDVAYIISYAVTVIACLLYVNPWIWVFTIPALVVKSLQKFWLTAKSLSILETNLNWNIEKVVSKVTNTINMAKWWLQNTSRILERWRNISDHVKTWTSRMKWTSDELVASREVLRKLNDTVILADIFGKNMDKFISNKENTDIALKVYEEEILKGNWIVLDNLEDMIKESNWELQYNLLRIRERFDEMGEIFEREVFPAIEEMRDLNFFRLWAKKEYLENKIKDSKLNQLTIVILSQYRSN